MSFQLTVHRPGPFSDQPALYLEDSDGLREVRLTVRGEAVSPPSPDGGDERLERAKADGQQSR